MSAPLCQKITGPAQWLPDYPLIMCGHDSQAPSLAAGIARLVRVWRDLPHPQGRPATDPESPLVIRSYVLHTMRLERLPARDVPCESSLSMPPRKCPIPARSLRKPCHPLRTSEGPIDWLLAAFAVP